MNNHTLNKEEKETLEAVEALFNDQKITSTLTKARKEELKLITKETIQKTKSINVRLNVTDLAKLKSKALENGMPYQTIVSTLVHQYNKGKLKIEL